MTYPLEDLKTYLPKYLSTEEQSKLFEALKDFPEGINKNFFSEIMKGKDFLAQGDCLINLKLADYQKDNFKLDAKGILISNTCDASDGNPRMYHQSLTFSPLFDLKKYREIMEKFYAGKNKEETIKNHLNALVNQKLTSFFYIPNLANFEEGAFIRLDQMWSYTPSKTQKEDLIKTKLFSLSNPAFYFFLIKLSIHFTRVQESIDRTTGEEIAPAQ